MRIVVEQGVVDVSDPFINRRLRQILLGLGYDVQRLNDQSVYEYVRQHIKTGRISVSLSKSAAPDRWVAAYQLSSSFDVSIRSHEADRQVFYQRLPKRLRPEEPQSLHRKDVEPLQEQTTILLLNYFYDDDAPIENISYEVTDSEGTKHRGKLNGGVANLAGLPLGPCQIDYIGLDVQQEKELERLKQTFSDYLDEMVSEVKQVADREDALFDKESLLSQGLILSGAFLQGAYDGGKSLIFGVADMAGMIWDVGEEAAIACVDLCKKLSSGDIEGVKEDLETILANSEKQYDALNDSLQLLATLIEDDDICGELAAFPQRYIKAHSQVEETRMLGVFGFEVLLTLLTLGAGAAVSALSKSKYLIKANAVLGKMAKLLRRKRLRKTKKQNLQVNTNRDDNKISKGEKNLKHQVGKNEGELKSDKGQKRTEQRFWKKTVNFQGNKVYQRDDLIDPDLVDKLNRTNLQRMQKGLAPIGPDGKSINLHHMTQSQNDAIAEMTQTFHQKNSKVIHINPKSIPSGIDRNKFQKWRSDYWKNRAHNFQ